MGTMDSATEQLRWRRKTDNWIDFMKVMADLDYSSFSVILSKKTWFHRVQENMGSEKLEMRSEKFKFFFFFPEK